MHKAKTKMNCAVSLSPRGLQHSLPTSPRLSLVHSPTSSRPGSAALRVVPEYENMLSTAMFSSGTVFSFLTGL